MRPGGSAGGWRAASPPWAPPSGCSCATRHERRSCPGRACTGTVRRSGGSPRRAGGGADPAGGVSIGDPRPGRPAHLVRRRRDRRWRGAPGVHLLLRRLPDLHIHSGPRPLCDRGTHPCLWPAVHVPARQPLRRLPASRARYGAPRWQVDAWVSTYVAIANGEFAGVTDDIPGSPVTRRPRWPNCSATAGAPITAELPVPSGRAKSGQGLGDTR
jgi:hypothetical protein